jgi:hypothetical protein
VDLEVRRKGFAIVPAGRLAPRPSEKIDADERARFENILSFRRRREAGPGRVIGVASAVMAALILSPALGGLPERASREAPPSSRLTTPEAIAPAPGATSDGHPSPARVSGTRAPRALHAPGANRAFETYAARVEEATERFVSEARGLIGRVKSDVIGNVGPEPAGDEDPATAKPPRAQSP